MNLLGIYRTETDWCALIGRTFGAPGEQRLTLTYAEEPDEAQVLEDAERAFQAIDNEGELPPLVVNEEASQGEKREQVLSQVEALRAFVDSHAEAFADVAALKAALAAMTEGVG